MTDGTLDFPALSPQHIVGGHFGGQRHGGFQRDGGVCLCPGAMVGQQATLHVDVGHHDGAVSRDHGSAVHDVP